MTIHSNEPAPVAQTEASSVDYSLLRCAPPSLIAVVASAHDRLARAVEEGRFSMEELIEHYVSMIYAEEARHYGRASKRLDMDWRTLKQKLNQKLIESYSDR